MDEGSRPRAWSRAAWCLLAGLALLAPPQARAQQADGAVVGGGGGVTYYCIVSRCNTGATLVGLVGYAPRPFLVIAGTGRWHACFDCDRFVMVEASLQLRHPGRTVQPFLGVGAGLSSDPEFMGDRFGPHVALGAWLWPSPRWGLQAEVRGRSLGSGDRMGEASLAVARRLTSGSRER